MSFHVLLVLSLGEALILILILALSLTTIHDLLQEISDGLNTLGEALATVESEHLRPLEGAVKAINAQFGLMPGVAAKAAIVASHVEKEEAK